MGSRRVLAQARLFAANKGAQRENDTQVISHHIHDSGYICRGLAGAEQGHEDVMKRIDEKASPARQWRLGRVLSAMLLMAGFSATETGALAQSLECNRLQAQIASLGPPGMGGDPARAQQFRQAAQNQQSELERTASYSRSIGCERKQFLFFGDAPPPECGQIGQQIGRMRNNLEQLRAQAQQAGGDDGQRRDLTARYEATCRGQQPASRNLLETLFGGGASNPRDVPLEGAELFPQEDAPPGAGSVAVCVRSCDGGFFPVSYSANRARYGELGELCQAMCPNAETQLFTMAFGREIEQSVSSEGKPYTSLPNAARFRTKYDPTCTCKRTDQSWVEALGTAEKLLGRDSRRDQIVTPERAAELSRPQAARPTKPDPKAAAKASPKASAIEQEIAADAATGAQVPTASKESAGIAVGGGQAGSNYTLRDGATREVTTPDGLKRKVRTVGPLL